MTYARHTLQEEEVLPTGFTEVRKDFLFLFSLSCTASSSWSGTRTSGVEWRTVCSWVHQVLSSSGGIWGATPAQWPSPLCEEKNNQNRNAIEVFLSRGRCLGLQ